MASVLIVDDEPENLELLEAVLTPVAHSIRKAAGGREALQAVEQEAPELILLDLMMPGESVLATLEQLQQRFPDLPVIILTAHPSSQNAITALKLGAFDFIVKGLQPDLLVVAVRRGIHRFAERREKRELIVALEGRVRELESRLAALSGTPPSR
jgi:DNA-binding NtrC family response regulator